MILVNARFLTQEITGVQRYAIEMSLQLIKIIPDIQFVSPKGVLHEDLYKFLGAKSIGMLSGHAWEQFELPIYAFRNNRALIINLCNTAPVCYLNKFLVLHDVAYVRLPSEFSLKFRLFYMLTTPLNYRTARAIFTVSQFSKDEILRTYGLHKHEIAITYNAVGEQFTPRASSKNDSIILAASSLTPRKNLSSLVQAFNLLNDPNALLFIIGGVEKFFGPINIDIKSNPNIRLLSRISDTELIALYSQAICFAYPSFYEGFGLPPLEAQACGCPCLVSNAASLPEVFSDSAIYCDPHSVEDIAKKLVMLIDDSALREELREKGFRNAKRFSWKNSAEKMKNIIESER